MKSGNDKMLDSQDKGNAAVSSTAGQSQESKSSAPKRSRSARAGTKRRLETFTKQNDQFIRYDREFLLILRDSRLSSAWPRALDKAFVGDNGLWDPVKLFEGEKRGLLDSRPRIERSRNVRSNQLLGPGALADDGQAFGRASRRRKRNKEEVTGPTGGQSRQSSGSSQQDQLQLRSKSESEKENKIDKNQRADKLKETEESKTAKSRLPQQANYAARRSERSSQWERSQKPREQLPAWFDEGPTDKMEKMELTGLPADMVLSDEKQESAGAGDLENTGSRIKKWMPDEQTNSAAAQLEKRICEDLKLCQKSAADQLQQKQKQEVQAVEASLKSMLFGSSDNNANQLKNRQEAAKMRTLQEIESTLGAADASRTATNNIPANLPISSTDPRDTCGDRAAIYKLIGDLQVQMRESRSQAPKVQPQPQPTRSQPVKQQAAPNTNTGFTGRIASGSTVSASAPSFTPSPSTVAAVAAAAAARSAANAQQQKQQLQQQQQQQQLQQQQQQQHQNQHQHQHQQQQQFKQQQQQFSQFSSDPLASAAAQRQRQQLQQLQAMLLSNLQIQEQMLHTGQLSAGAFKDQSISKLLPQPFFYSSPKPLMLPNNAMIRRDLIRKQQLYTAADVADLNQSFDNNKSFGESFQSKQTGAVSPGATRSGSIAQPAMPIVPPMLLQQPASSTGGGSLRSSAWGNSHSQQINAMLWNATKLNNNVKSSNAGSHAWSFGGESSQSTNARGTVGMKATDEIGSA